MWQWFYGDIPAYRAYPSHIERESSTTLVYYEDVLAGYFTIKHEETNYPPWLDGSSYSSSLDIARLAVCSDFQNNRLGTYIIKYIINMAIQVNERFITLDSLYERWEWYKRFGFNYLFEEDVRKPSEIVTMILDLYDEDLVMHITISSPFLSRNVFCYS
ncbi:GNAT family N-acetyltransferase [Paenibacillus sp. GCM10027626]|uniref:GNAT family N-acetyltransferase n=1 Tax=Paenibacillus sp. GCM10027626 TaxID=3273411 RepID=UPI00363F14FE